MKDMEAKDRKWTLYNLAQTSEKTLFMKVLSDAVDALDMQQRYCGDGRPSTPIDDMIKACCIKVFNGFSARRTVPDLEFAKAMGYIREVPHFNSIGNYLKNPTMAQHLHALYRTLAMPLAPFESYFAIDSTGFGSFNRVWLNSRLDLNAKKNFNKLHVITGYLTTVITTARVTSPNEHDVVMFPNMLRDSCKSFNVKEICGDKGYLAGYNCDAAAELCVTPYIMPKSSMRSSAKSGSKSEAWKDMLRMWEENRKVFEDHYHRRSLVESAFSSMKRKFLPFIRSRNSTAQGNEILCKVVCHNASVLITAIFELGAKAEFSREANC